MLTSSEKNFGIVNVRCFITLFLFFFPFLLHAIESPLKLDLRSPTYENGSVETQEGGVLENDQIRIQATHIQYTKREEGAKTVWTAKADKNLSVRYGNKNFVAQSLEYDFQKRTGVLRQACTQVGPWFLHSQEVLLHQDGSYSARKTSLTTCENNSNLWQIHLNRASLHPNEILTAQNAQVRVLNVPIFWYPYLKMKLSNLKYLAARYTFVTGRPQTDKISMRYLAYSSETLRAHLQLDYWFKRGPGALFLLDYKSTTHPTSFNSSNFLAHDKRAKKPRSGDFAVGNFRQRYEGQLVSQLSDRLSLNLQYEQLSDPYVLQTYFNRDYFLTIPKHTHIGFNYRDELWVSSLRTKVRINTFETTSQELPWVQLNIRAFKLYKSPLLADFSTSFGYLDYRFANILENTFQSFQSPRAILKPKLYWPIRLAGFAITPQVEYVGIGYGQTPLGNALWNSWAKLGVNAHWRFFKNLSPCLKHTVNPYLSYEFRPAPSVPLQDHFFFDIEDASHALNQLRWGLKTSLVYKNQSQFSSPLTLDIYSIAFFKQTEIGSQIPRMYCEVNHKLPFLQTSLVSAYNFQHQKIDHINVRTAFTFSENFAASILFMHRSAYDFRKANPNSFLVEVSRNQSNLINSPLSDRRNTIQSKVYWRVIRRLIVEFESRAGWHRAHSPSYNEYWFNFTILLPCNWRLILSPQRVISPYKGKKYTWRYHMHLKLGGEAPKEASQPYIYW